MRRDEPRLVWTSLRLSAHHALVKAGEMEIATVERRRGPGGTLKKGSFHYCNAYYLGLRT
jgi:hypothetical protein